MKFWQLIAAFRSETDNIRKVFSNQRWKKYEDAFNNLESIIKRQGINILHEEIPFELAKEVCESSKIKYYLYYTRRPQLLISYQIAAEEPFEVLTPFEVLVRYGGVYVEEVLEKTYAEVMPRPIGSDIEVLAVYELTNIGMIAFLRMENGFLKKEDKICSQDNLRQWKIIDEPMLFGSAQTHEKIKTQREQGIRQYKIEPIDGSGRPIETELLKLQ